LAAIAPIRTILVRDHRAPFDNEIFAQVLTANLTAKALHTGVQKAKNWTAECTK
jgi:hypothetical protein